jgi:hypothetical protein
MASVIICDGFNLNASIPQPHTDKMVTASYLVTTTNIEANWGDDTTVHYCGECFGNLLNTWTTGGFPNERSAYIKRV